MAITRVFDLLDHQVEKYNKPDTISAKVNGKWIHFSTNEYRQLSRNVSLGLIKKGIKKDDKIAIISPNRPEWNIVEMGIQMVGAVSVPLYPTITVEDYRFILNDSESKIVFVANGEIYEKVREAIKGMDHSVEVYSFDKLPIVAHWTEIEQLGKGENPTLLEDYKKQVTPSDLLTIIYTSGTTGVPKGVMLTHNNLVSNFLEGVKIMPVDHNCKALSFLPLCHVYERMLSYVYQYGGLSIYYAESMDTIADNMKEIHPHIFVTVPRLLEKVYDKIVAKGMELKGIKRGLFFWALDLGLKYDLNHTFGVWYDVQLWLANKLIFNKWREALGGNVKCIVSGGAALQPRLARVFSAAQIRVLEGYGLTETSPVIAVNHMEKENNRIGTVGPLLTGVEVKIAEDGEILTRGPHIMKGYYKRPDLTEQAIDADGWFHTGDIGIFTEGKFLKITDRKKEIFKTSGGKYIAPQVIENKFKESKVIEQIMVVGEGQKFPSALIVPNFGALKDYCKFKEIPYSTDAEMILDPKVLDKFQRDIDELNEGFAQYEKIKRFKLVPNQWTINDGELTPTLKLKRKAILAKCKHLVDEIYETDNAMA
ncbi:MAG: long-chain fatty acid--CoA ligase [Cytophagales bacterium]|nr:long-chain fatty acid--CoA ligase [Cytophagales bacterium]